MRKSKQKMAGNPAENIVKDSLTEFLRESAQMMLQKAINVEVQKFMQQYQEQLENQSQRVVRNGYLPKRGIQTGIGSIEVKIPRVRDRKNAVQFSSSLVPKYMRRTVSLEVLIPLLYLKGISTNDMSETLIPLLGIDPKNVSPSVIGSLKKHWYDDYQNWQKQNFKNKKFVYWWVDGIYVQARMEHEKTCLLVIVGADEEGRKQLIGLTDGFRESKESWRSLLLDLKNRGLEQGACLAIGDGALGFWGAVSEVYPKTEHQRCWVHKTANVLDKLPKSQQAKAKSMLHEIYHAADEKDALKALEKFNQTYQAKYEKAVVCLNKDKEKMLAFYHYPAEHWIHIRTTNPIESTFATVRHRTKRSKNCFSRETIIACVFKLCLEAEKRWRPLKGREQIDPVLKKEKFVDGVICTAEPSANKDDLMLNEDAA